MGKLSLNLLLICTLAACSAEVDDGQDQAWVLGDPSIVLPMIYAASAEQDFIALRDQWSRAQFDDDVVSEGQKRNRQLLKLNLAVALLSDVNTQEESFAYLSQVARDTDPYTRENLALALSQARDARSLQLLRVLAEDTDESVSKAALESIRWRSRK